MEQTQFIEGKTVNDFSIFSARDAESGWLHVRTCTARAESPVQYFLDYDGEADPTDIDIPWKNSPFQCADAAHDIGAAHDLIADYLQDSNE